MRPDYRRALIDTAWTIIITLVIVGVIVAIAIGPDWARRQMIREGFAQETTWS